VAGGRYACLIFEKSGDSLGHLPGLSLLIPGLIYPGSEFLLVGSVLIEELGSSGGEAVCGHAGLIQTDHFCGDLRGRLKSRGRVLGRATGTQKHDQEVPIYRLFSHFKATAVGWVVDRPISVMDETREK